MIRCGRSAQFDNLLPYFAEHHEHEERLQLVEINVIAAGGSDGASIYFVLTRQADDLAPGLHDPQGFVTGGGGIYCKSQTISN